MKLSSPSLDASEALDSRAEDRVSERAIFYGERVGRRESRRRLCFILCLILSLFLVVSLAYMTSTGVGVLGVHNGVTWGWDILNFVFWIGIAHAGTLISAILLLTRQLWRRSISRIAELITLCAVLCAGIYPLFHVGRVWMSWFLIPMPETSGMWQNFLSPLMWDAFAVGTYACVSTIFFYVSMIPDIALMRDAAGKGSLRREIYDFLSWGWRGTPRSWVKYRRLCWLLAALLTPLVVSVHSIVSYDFAVTLVPGWHTTLFPPYFVAGAILSGLAMVAVVVIPLRRYFGLRDFIAMGDLATMMKLLAGIAVLIGCFYGWEYASAYYWGSVGEWGVLCSRATGEGWRMFWLMVACNVVVPQVLWIRKLRCKISVMLGVSFCVLLGMWVERLLIVVGAMERSFLVEGWTSYMPSWVDVAMFAGSFGLFGACILGAMKFFPLVNLHEWLPENEVEKGEEHEEEEAWSESDDFLGGVGEVEVGGGEARVDSSFGARERGLEFWVVIGALGGGIVAFVFLWWSQLVDYPMLLQGRDADAERLFGFIPVIFEMMILGGALSVFGAWMNKGGGECAQERREE